MNFQATFKLSVDEFISSVKRPYTLEMPCLGREFQLGMLYDCRTDSLIPDVTLWDSETLSSALSKTPLESSDFEIIAEDVLSKKISSLGADAGLKLSLLVGMVGVGGAAKFLNDHKSSKKQARVSLKYKSTTKFEQLNMSHLAMKHFVCKDVFNKDVATHIVTGIVYGANAFFVFDKEIKGHENMKVVQRNLRLKVEKLSGLAVGSTGTVDTEEEMVQCRFYGDFHLPKHPITFHDATKIYQELPELLKGKSVPIIVLLCPLGKLDTRAERRVCDISIRLIDELNEIMESLHEATISSNDLIRTEVCSNFLSLKQDLEELNRLINGYTAALKKTLAALIPTVCGCGTNEDKLAKVIMSNSQSPFNSQSLSTWISEKASEVKILARYLEHLEKLEVHLAFGPGEVEVYINDLEIDTVVCFDFGISWGKDFQLERMEAYIQGRQASQMKTIAQPWYRNQLLTQEMRRQFRCFRNFVDLNHSRQNDTVKYIVTNRERKIATEFNFILQYEGSQHPSVHAFKLPDQPSGLQATVLSCDSLQLKWDKPNGAEYIKSYIISFHSNNDPPDQWSYKTIDPGVKQQFVLSDLIPGSIYYLKIRAETTAGCSQDSEVCKTTILPPGQPSKPQASNITINSLRLTWGKPKHGAELVKSYTVTCCLPQHQYKVYKFPEKGPQVYADFSDLTSQTRYAFKVRAESVVGSSPDSEPSDLIETQIPISQPGKPCLVSATHNCIMLKWSSPKLGAKAVTNYILLYKIISEDKWNSSRVYPSVQKCTYSLSPLKSDTIYFFEVKAEATGQFSPPSELSDPIKTKLSPPFGKPTVSDVTYTNFRVHWQKPNYDGIVHYSIQYYTTDEDQKLHYLESNGPALSIVFDAANDKLYVFRVAAVTAIETSSYGEPSDPFETRDLPWGAKLYKNLEQIPESNPPTYVLPTHCVVRKKDIVKVHVGSKKPKRMHGVNKMCTCHTRTMGVPHKVLMVIGATGAGKTTLINGITNYILGVNWEDDFRFKLIAEPTSQDQSKSQTMNITAYTFYKDKGSPLQYTLTIIDTPGFGDTGGLDRDKHIVSQIKELFSIKGEEGIDQLHGIGFVTQAPLARLTPTQRYVFDSILSVFGKDVANNIFLMITFADGMRPPVLDAVKAADVPSTAFFKFNNSALFAPKQDDNEFDSMFWKMGVKSFKEFFDKFSNATAQSLQQTREVMQERERLETVVQGLQPQITAGLAKIDELRQERQVLRSREADILTNQEFSYQVEVTKQRKVDLPKGKYTTNCLTCNYTCHKDCSFANDKDKYRCAAMKKNKGSSNAECGICPGKCLWNVHHNNPYRFELYQEKVTRTSQQLKRRYESALDNKEQVEAVITNMKKDLKNMNAVVLCTLNQARRCIERLQEIALRPNHLTEVEYIDLLIESEKREAKPRWLDRVKALEGVRKQAEIVSKLMSEGEQIDPIFTDESGAAQKLSKSWLSWS